MGKIFISFILLIPIFYGCENTKPALPMESMSEEEFAKLPKTVFEYKGKSITQNLQITWVNDTSLIWKLVIDSAAVHANYSSLLIEKYPDADYEMYEDTSGEAHATREFSIEEKSQKIYVCMKVAADTSFAVLMNYDTGLPDSNSKLYLKRILTRKQ